MDDFPRTAEQAQAFERAISKLDLDAEAAYAAAAARTAPPPPDAFPPADRPLASCLDTVVILELEDHELVLDRAVGLRVDPQSGERYHLIHRPPPANDPGLLERLVVTGAAPEQVQERMAAHLATASALHAWLQRFERLAQRLDGNATLEELQQRVLAIAQTTSESKAAAAQCASAAAAAQEAQAGAAAAAESAQAARRAAAAAASELLLAKRAELEASQLLGSPPDSAGGAKKKGVKVDPTEEAAAQEAADAARKLLAAEAATRCAQHLRAGNEACTEASKHAEAAQAQAQAAAEAQSSSERSRFDAARSREAEQAALRAAGAAKAACEAAAAAAQRATTAAEAAAQVLALAQGRVAATEAAPTAENQKALAAPVTTEDAEPVNEGDSAAGAADAADAAASPALPQSASQYLHDMWQHTEQVYISAATASFAGVRELRQAMVQHVSTVSEHLAKYLNRPDGKQAELTKFVLQYNEVSLDALAKPEVQAELMLQADEMRDRLWAICDARDAENEKVVAAWAKEPFAADAADALAARFVGLLQSELDRYAAALSFARDHAALSAGVPPAPALLKQFTVSTAPPDADLAPLLDAKKGAQFPAWLDVPGTPASVQQAARVVAAACMFYTANTGLEDPAKVKPKDKKGVAAKPPAAAKGKGAAASAEPAATVAPEAYEAAAAAFAPVAERERELLEARIRAILRRAAAHASDVATVAQKCDERAREATKRAFQAECEVVASAAQHIKACIAAGEKVPSDLRLERHAAVVDASVALVPGFEPKGALPAAVQQKPAGLLNTWHIAALVDAVQALATGDFCATRTLAGVVQQVAAAAGPQRWPQQWRAATLKQLREVLAAFDPHCSSYVDWRHAVMCLVLHAFPALAQASAATLAAAAAALAAAGSDGDGKLTHAEWQGVQLWFEVATKRPGCAEDLEGEHVDAHAAAGAACKSVVEAQEAAALKQLLWQLFSKVRAARMTLCWHHTLRCLHAKPCAQAAWHNWPSATTLVMETMEMSDCQARLAGCTVVLAIRIS